MSTTHRQTPVLIHVHEKETVLGFLSNPPPPQKKKKKKKKKKTHFQQSTVDTAMVGKFKKKERAAYNPQNQLTA